jgi:glyoxylase-like metal-dependent hydrolase (beta-lactamase superfamily II)
LANIGAGLEVWQMGCNAGVFRRGDGSLIIGGPVAALLERAGIAPGSVEVVLCTHHDRMAAPGLPELAAAGARVHAPVAEAGLLRDAQGFWAGGGWRVHGYHFHPSHRVFAQNVPVAVEVVPGDAFEWRGVRFEVMPGAGPTGGGVTYLAEAGGPRVAFVGDLMCGHGRLREFHTLQGARPLPGGGRMMEYHGFGERCDDLLRSLDAVLDRKPDLLVPSFGAVVTRPAEAVALLRRRIEAAMAAYHATTSARWYFAGMRPEWPADRSEGEARLRPLPEWVRELSPTSRLIVAPNGEALLIDSAGEAADAVAALLADGEIRAVESLWVTHTHDDHVERVNEARNRLTCAVVAHRTLQGILEAPEAYLMPCLDPTPIPVDRVTIHGETWEWRGFRLTALDFPGQTALDAALLVERDGERVLFVGDSLTPGGLDDYCALNRNHLGRGRGMDACLQTLASLPCPTLLVNQHCPGAFDFSQADIRRLRAGLRTRRARFRELLAWDDPNYGLDAQWVRLEPYHRRARPGQRLTWDVVVQNHSAGPSAGRIQIRDAALGSAEQRLSATGHDEARCTVTGATPSEPGVHTVLFDLVWNGRALPAVAEAIVDVDPTA